MPESRTSAALQLTSHGLVIGAALVYLFGFLIVSIFDASYGIADFSIFRTKVIAVGTLFVFLIAIAMVLTFRMFSLFGLTLQRAHISAVTITPQNRLLLIVDVASSIPFASLGLAYLLPFLFDEFLDWKGPGTVFIFLVLAVGAVLGVSGKKWFNKLPLLFVFLSYLNTSFLLWIVLRYASRSTFWFVVWFSLVCAFTLVTSLKILNPAEVRRTEWERMLLLSIPAIFGLYATKVYPNIKHQYGGGASVSIMLHLTKKLPVFDSDSVPVALIDETEQGYYVVRGSEKAVFVPRGLVEEVEFLRMPPIEVAPTKP